MSRMPRHKIFFVSHMKGFMSFFYVYVPWLYEFMLLKLKVFMSIYQTWSLFMFLCCTEFMFHYLREFFKDV